MTPVRLSVGDLRRWGAAAWPYALLPVLFFTPVLMGGLLSGGDLVNQYIPWKEYWRASVAAGDWPLWNPLTFGGQPFLANIQVGQLYPPNWIFLLLPAAPAFTFLVVAHVVFGMIGMARLAGRLVDSRGGRFVAAAVFHFSGFFMSRYYEGVIMFVLTAAWTPWILDTALMWTRRMRPRHALALAALLALQTLSGAPQIVFYTLLALAVWAPFGLCARLRGAVNGGGLVKSRAPHTKKYEIVLLGYLLALLLLPLLTLAQVWPTWEFVRDSFGRASGASLEFVTSGSMTWRMMVSQFVPFFFLDPTEFGLFWGCIEGYHEMNAYVGWTTWMLAVVGLAAGWEWAARRDRDARWHGRVSLVHFAMALAVIALVLCFGARSPVFLWFYHHVPGFDLFRHPARILMLLTLAQALLAAVGWEILVASPALHARVRRRARVGLAVFAALALGGLAMAMVLHLPFVRTLGVLKVHMGASFDSPTPQLEAVLAASRNALQTALGWAVAVAVTGLVALTPWGEGGVARWRGPALAAALGALLLADLRWYGTRFLVTTPAAEFEETFYPRTPLVDLLRERAERPGGRMVYTDDVVGFLVDQNADEITCERLMMRGVPQVRGYHPLRLGRYVEFSNLWRDTRKLLTDDPGGFLKVGYLDERKRQALDPWNARTIVTYQDLDAVPGLARVADFEFPRPMETPWTPNDEQINLTHLRVYDNAMALGEAWLTTAHPALDREDGQILDLLASGRFDLRTQALVQSRPVPPRVYRTDEESVEVMRQSADRLWLEVESGRQRLLVVSRPWSRGWRATVNDREMPVLRVNHAMLGVAMPGGEADVELVYAPTSVRVGRWVSLAAWLVWAVLFALTYNMDLPRSRGDVQDL